MLESTDGGRSTRVVGVFPVALHLRAVAVSADRVWVGGDTKRGRGLLLVRSGAQGVWRRVSLPAQVSEVRDVAVVASDVWIAGRAGRTGVLLRRLGGAWREVARIRPASDRPAALVRVGIGGSGVVAVGGDGTAGVLVFSAGRGERAKTIRPRRLDSATAVTQASGEIVAMGYRAPGGIVENATGMLLRTNRRGYRRRFNTDPLTPVES